jgi:hypothetical protein
MQAMLQMVRSAMKTTYNVRVLMRNPGQYGITGKRRLGRARNQDGSQFV